MKASSKRTKRVQVVLVVIAIVAAYAATLHAGKFQTARKGYASISAQQIAAKAAPFCRMLSGTDQALEQTVEERDIRRADGILRKAWAVECGNPDGAHFVRTIWDAQTGELIYAGHMTDRSEIGHSPHMPKSGAADVAWHWMSQLGVAPIASSWKVCGSPELIQNSWRVVMNSREVTATVVFDYQTHNLVYLNVKRDHFYGIVS